MTSWRLQNSGQAADVLTSIMFHPFSAEARKLFSPLDSMCLGQNLDPIIHIYIYIRDGHQPIFIGIDILITKGTKYGITINIIYHALTMVQIGIGTRQVYQLAAPKRQVRSQPVGCHHTVLLLFCSTNLNGLD